MFKTVVPTFIKQPVVCLAVIICLVSTSWAYDKESIPGLNITIRDLNIPEEIGSAIRGGQPSFKPIQGENVTRLMLQYKAMDQSKALVRIQILVPSLNSSEDQVHRYFRKQRDNLVSRAEKRGHKKISVVSSNSDFESIYEVPGRRLHFKHKGSIQYENAYLIDVISNIDHAWKSSQADYLASDILLKLHKAKYPANINIPGHSMTISNLGFPAGIDALKLKGEVEILRAQRRFYSMVWVDYTSDQPKAKVILRLYIPASGSDDLDRASKLIWEDYTKSLAFNQVPGFELTKNEKWDTGFFISTVKRQDGFRRKMMGNIYGSYGYTIGVEDKLDKPAQGIDKLKQIAEDVIKSLEAAVQPGCKIKKTGPFEPGVSECYEPEFPDLPRANMLVKNMSSFSIYMDTFGEPLEKDGVIYQRHTARVMIPARTEKLVHHALPVGRKTIVYADNEKWYENISHLKWIRYINNNGEATCKKRYILTFRDADFGVGAGPKGGWGIQGPAIQAPDQWETVVE